MPSWTLSDIVSTATQALGNRSDIALSDASFWANEAQRMVWDAMPNEFQEKIAVSSTTVNEDKITLPTDFQELLHLSNLSDDPPSSLVQINLENAETYSTVSGTPTHYYLYGDYLSLKPTPDSAYSLQLRYRNLVSDMTELTDVPSIATRFRQAIFIKTKELLAQNVIRAPELAAEARAEYVSYMNMTPSDRALRQRERRFFAMSVPRKRDQTPGTTTGTYDFDTSDY